MVQKCASTHDRLFLVTALICLHVHVFYAIMYMYMYIMELCTCTCTSMLFSFTQLNRLLWKRMVCSVYRPGTCIYMWSDVHVRVAVGIDPLPLLRKWWAKVGSTKCREQDRHSNIL